MPPRQSKKRTIASFSDDSHSSDDYTPTKRIKPNPEGIKRK
jgi:hypothetical protein